MTQKTQKYMYICSPHSWLSYKSFRQQYIVQDATFFTVLHFFLLSNHGIAVIPLKLKAIRAEWEINASKHCSFYLLFPKWKWLTIRSWLLALIIFPESVTWSGKYLSSCYTYVFVKHHVVCGNVLLQCVFPLVYVTFVAWCDNWIMTFVFWMFIRVDGNVEIFQGYKKTVTTIFILFQTIYSIGFHSLGTGRQRRSFCAV